MSTKVEKITKKGENVEIETSNSKGEKSSHDCDVALISIGRKAFTDNLNLEKIKLKTDEKGRVKVDKNLRQNKKIFCYRWCNSRTDVSA